MKKNIFTAIKKAFIAVAVALVLPSCANIISRAGDDSSSSDSASSNGDKVVVSFDITSVSRTALPEVDLTAYTYTLTGMLSGGNEQTLCEGVTYNKITAAIETGSWTFTVTGYSGSTAVLTGTKTMEVTTSTPISLKLAAATGGTGSVSVTLKYPVELGAATVKAALYDSYEASLTDAGSELTVTQGTAYNSVKFTAANVPTGVTKYLAFYLYNSSSTQVSKYTETVYVVNGLTSESTYTIVGSTTTATVTVQKDGSDWVDSGLVLSVTDGTTSYDMTAGEGTALYTANVPSGSTYTINVNGSATSKTITDTSNDVTLNYAVPTLYPAQGATDAFADTQLILSFSNTTFTSGVDLKADSSVAIYEGSGTSVAATATDTISVNSTSKDESQSTQSGYTVNVGNQQLVRADGSTVYIQPHYNGTTSATVLQSATTYTVKLNDIVTLPSGVDGIMFEDGTTTWSFTTKAAPTVSTTMSVSNATSSNTADFFSVYGALWAISKNGATSTTYQLDIADGTYYELVSVKPKSGQTIILHGTSESSKGSGVLIEYVNNQYLSALLTTSSAYSSQAQRASFYVANGNLILENVTLENLTQRTTSYSYTGKYYDADITYNGSQIAKSGAYQAEALNFASGAGSTLTAYNSSFVSLQDTILTSGKVWFYGCYIAGDVDFIWGTSDVALFENCDIECLNTSATTAYIFESRVGSTSGTSVGKGYVLLNSTVTVDSGVTAYYARRASGKSSTSYYDQVALVNIDFSSSPAAAHYYVGNEPEALTGTLYGDYADVGWKEYNVTVNSSAVSTSSRYAKSGDITSTEYTNEYSGRRAIINRYYNKTDDCYAKDTTTHWDIDTLISDRGYTVASDSSIVDASAYIVGDGGTITDSDNIARADSLAITTTETPSGYAGVNWTSPTYSNGVKVVDNRADLLTYAKAGGYIVVVNGMIDMTTGYNGSTMLPTTGGDTTAALDAFVNAKSSGAYTNYAAWKAAYAAACTTTTDDSSGKTAGTSGTSSLYDALWTLNNAYKNVVQVAVESNTMIIGADSNSGIRGGTLSISGESYITIRNMKIQDAYDPFPHHEAGDGYNGERDGINIQGDCNHIWIDHCTLEDTLTPDHVKTAGTTNEKWQNYDGLLDIKGTGAYITVSYNKFKNHDKTSLIGSDDSEGSNSTRLITYHHNYFYNCGQRMPMVRNTTLHTYNNVYAYSNGDYEQQYAIGPRSGVIIYAENNYFGSGITYAFKGKDASAIHSSGNVLNNGSTESEDNVNYNGVSKTDSTKFSEQTSPAYTYDVDAISTITDNSTGVAAKSGTGDATVDGTAYGSSTGTGTTFIEITFNANAEDATITTSTQSVASGTATALKTATALGLTRSGYSFSGGRQVQVAKLCMQTVQASILQTHSHCMQYGKRLIIMQAGRIILFLVQMEHLLPTTMLLP